LGAHRLRGPVLAVEMDDELLFTWRRLGCARHSVGVKIRKGLLKFPAWSTGGEDIPATDPRVEWSGSIRSGVPDARRIQRLPSRAMVMPVNSVARWLAVRNTIVRDRRISRLNSINWSGNRIRTRLCRMTCIGTGGIAAAIMPRTDLRLRDRVQVPCALAEFGEASGGYGPKLAAGTFINAIAPDFGRREGGTE